MTKFPNREDPGYDRILGEIERWIKTVQSESSAEIQTR